MNDIVVPICDPAEATWAESQAIALWHADAPARIHLLNVQRPLPKHVAQFFNRNDLREFHREAGMHVLEPAMRLLDEAGVPHEDHVLVGHPAETIVRFADDHECKDIVVDSPRKTGLSIFGLGSIGSQVRHLMHARTPNAQASGVTSVT